MDNVGGASQGGEPMSFELLHFRDSQKIIRKKKMIKDIMATMENVDETLSGAHFKGELLRLALDDMGWRENGDLNIIEGRRYQ